MPKFVFGLLLIFLGSLLQAQTDAKQEVSGTVVNSATGQPISGALVILQPRPEHGDMQFDGEPPPEEIQRLVARTQTEPAQRILTDASGRYSFGIHSAAFPLLTVSRRGFRSEEGGDTLSITLAPPKLTDTIVKLVPLAAIEGRVVNEDGEPLSGMTVEVIHLNIRNGRKLIRVDASKNTDDLGEYRLWDLSPGLAYLKFVGRNTTATGFASPSMVSLPEETYGSVYYPAAFSQSEAQTIRLHPGETMRADFTVAARRSYKIRGVLRNSTAYGRPTIRLMRGDDQVGVRTYVNASNGLFEMSDVTPGNYVIQAYSTGSSNTIFGETAVTMREADLSGIVVTLSSGVDVKGTVQFPSEISNSNPNPNRNPDFAEYSRRLVSVQALNNVADRPPVVRAQVPAGVDREGNFTFHNLFPGKYTITVPSYGSYVASIQAGSVDVLNEGLIVGSSEPPELRIVMNSGGGSIECKVDGLEPGAVATVVLVRGHGSTIIPITHVTNESPRPLKVPNLAPGEYKVFAWPFKREVEYYNPVALEALSGYGVSVYVKDGAEEKVTVKLAPAEAQ